MEIVLIDKRINICSRRQLHSCFNLLLIGPWAGNAGSNPQPFNCGIDYFMNTAAPITPEDGAYKADT